MGAVLHALAQQLSHRIFHFFRSAEKENIAKEELRGTVLSVSVSSVVGGWGHFLDYLVILSVSFPPSVTSIIHRPVRFLPVLPMRWTSRVALPT